MTDAYIQHHYKVVPEVYRYMLDHTEGMNADTRNFINHVTVSTIQRLNKRNSSLSIPVSSTLLKRELRRARIFDAEKLLTIRPYSYHDGLCREFEVQSWYLDGFIATSARLMALEYLQVEKVNLFSGKRARAVAKSVFYDDNRHAEAATIINAIKTIERNRCRFNLPAIEEHLSGMAEVREKALRDFGEDSQKYQSENGRYINDYCCSRAVLDQQPLRVGGSDIYEYTPAYSVASTGRIQHSGGGFQSCSRRMKQAAYSGISELRNYDLKGSQLAVLVQELIDAELDPTWLVDYLSASDGKYVYSAKAGMSVERWKQCVLALCMGARMPKSTSYGQARFNSVLGALLEEADNDLSRAERIRKRFADVVAPLLRELGRWHSYLIREFIQRNQQQSKRGTYIKNKVGKRLYLDDLSLKGEARKAKSQMAAFLLQGQEAAFIHALTVLGPEYGFRPISNEHDGLVVIGEIAKAAERKAASQSGFENAELVEKPFI